MYLQYPQLEIDECPLIWWKKEYIHLPMLSNLTRRFLCICATSVASERTFLVRAVTLLQANATV